jgi:hypothetical protein
MQIGDLIMYSRYVCLFTSKIGYSMGSTPSALCDVLDFDSITEAIVEHPDGVDNHEECSFVVMVSIEARTSTNGSPHKEDEDQVELSGGSKAASNDNILFTSLDEPDFPEDLRAVYSDYISKPGSPRSYHFRATSVAERDTWIRDINGAVLAHRNAQTESAVHAKSFIHRIQLRTRPIYFSVWLQMGTALLVALNFFFTV